MKNHERNFSFQLEKLLHKYHFQMEACSILLELVSLSQAYESLEDEHFKPVDFFPVSFPPSLSTSFDQTSI